MAKKYHAYAKKRLHCTNS